MARDVHEHKWMEIAYTYERSFKHPLWPGRTLEGCSRCAATRVVKREMQPL